MLYKTGALDNAQGIDKQFKSQILKIRPIEQKLWPKMLYGKGVFLLLYHNIFQSIFFCGKGVLLRESWHICMATHFWDDPPGGISHFQNWVLCSSQKLLYTHPTQKGILYS